MNKLQRSERLLALLLAIGVIGGVVLGILNESNRDAVEKTSFERIVGILAFFTVLIPMALYWIVPRTSWGKEHLRLTESMYGISFYPGIVLGVIGLLATMLQPQTVIRSHTFELLFALFGLNYVFWAMVMKARKTVHVSGILDEKQIHNLVGSAAETFLVVTGIMIVMYFVSYHAVFIIEGKIWFLLFFFLSMTIFSIFGGYSFRKN